MYGIQWFKVDKNIFNNRKIQLLLKHKDGDLRFRVWMQLLAIAVECGNNGRLEMGHKPITSGDCAKIMGKTSNKIKSILEEFLELGMLEKEGETFLIKNWDKYQSIDKYENYQIQNRKTKRYREKLKNENEKSNVIVTLSNTEEEKIIEKKTKEERKEEKIREEDENGFREYKL